MASQPAALRCEEEQLEQVDDNKLVSEAEGSASREIRESCQPAKGRGRGQLVQVSGQQDAAAGGYRHALNPGFSGPPPPPPKAFQGARAFCSQADLGLSGVPFRPISGVRDSSAPYPPVMNRNIAGFKPPVGCQVPRESQVFWETKGRYRMICECKVQSSIDCKFWDVSSFTDGCGEPLRDEMRRKGWRFPETGTKEGHEFFAILVGTFRLLDFALDSCDLHWEAMAHCHYLRQGGRKRKRWTNG